MSYIDEMVIMVITMLMLMVMIMAIIMVMMTKTFVTRSSPVQGEVAQHCVFI